MKNAPLPPQPPGNRKKQLNQYARYSGLGIQMGIIIALGAWGGVSLDAYWDIEPVLTIVLSLTGVFAALWIVYREVRNMQDNERKP